MTTTMSMRERREKIERLVQQDQRVQACAHTFDEAQAVISQWHANNDALTATKGALTELDELITYSEFCLEDLKCAKTAAYNQLMSQYPRVWDTSCDDPFFYTTAQTTAPEDGAEREETATLPETEEMSTVPATEIAHSHDLTASIGECPLCSMLDRDRIDARAALAASVQNLHMLTDKYIRQLENGGLGYDGLGEWTERLLEAGDDWSSHQSAVTNAEWRYRNAITVHSDLAAARRCEAEEMEEVPHADPLIRADKLMGILDREQAAYNVTIGFCDLWDLDASDLHARLATVQTIRTQLERLIDEAKEANNA